jgi:hypothetical protein
MVAALWYDLYRLADRRVDREVDIVQDFLAGRTAEEAEEEKARDDWWEARMMSAR